MSSHVATTIAQYSASTLDLEIIFCFLVFQDTKLPQLEHTPELNRLSEGDSAKSTNGFPTIYSVS